MKTMLTGLTVVCVWAGVVLPASAGWDNVFQPTFWHRRTTTSQYVAPVVVQSSPVVAQSSPCDPCQKCTTNYVHRSYYQPVTVTESRTVMEQVTTMQTSYYYAPVTTYRYSSYYDPCTCSYQQVAVPQCGYELRAKQCPVQSWVSRCVQVPVQAYQKVDYWQPVTTCCSTTVGAPVLSLPAQPMPPAAPSMAPIADQPPSISGSKSSPTDQPPTISGSKTPSKATMWDQYYPKIEKDLPPEIRGSGSSFQPKLGVPVPVKPAAEPPIRLDRIAVGADSHVDGQVVRSDSSPKASAKVLFINAMTGKRQVVTANTAGRFSTDLGAGSWHVYLHGADDQPIYHSRVDVNGAQTRQVNLVSRSN